MMDKLVYSNGQKTYEFEGQTLKYYYKNGSLKAQGLHIEGKMEGTWHFYRDNGQLAQIGEFKENMKHGKWIRYDKQGKIDYHEVFEYNIKTTKKDTSLN